MSQTTDPSKLSPDQSNQAFALVSDVVENLYLMGIGEPLQRFPESSNGLGNVCAYSTSAVETGHRRRSCDCRARQPRAITAFLQSARVCGRSSLTCMAQSLSSVSRNAPANIAIGADRQALSALSKEAISADGANRASIDFRGSRISRYGLRARTPGRNSYTTTLSRGTK